VNIIAQHVGIHFTPVISRALDHAPGARMPIWNACAVEIHATGRVDVMGAITANIYRGATTDLPELLRSTAAGKALNDAEAKGEPSIAWFEWDFDEQLNVATPYSMFAIDGAAAGSWSERQEPVDGSRIERIMRHFGGESYSLSVRQISDSLGSFGRLLHLGNLAPRGRSALRLCCFVDAIHVVPWLRHIGWPGCLSDVARALSVAAPFDAAVGVQLELTPHLSPYIGIEGSCWYSPADPEEVHFGMRAMGCGGIAAAMPRLVDWINGDIACVEDRIWRRAVYCKCTITSDATTNKVYLALVPRVH
jgi:hypothetical protein